MINLLIAMSVSGVYHTGWAWETGEPDGPQGWGSFAFVGLGAEVSNWKGELSFWPYESGLWSVIPIWVSFGSSLNLGRCELYPHIGAGWFYFATFPEAVQAPDSCQVSGLLLNAGFYPRFWIPRTNLGIGLRLDVLHYRGVKENLHPTIASLGFDLGFRFIGP